MAPGVPWEDKAQSPEADLVALAKTGDSKAFEAIMRAHESRIYRAAFGMLANREDALDACQEVFLRMYKYLDSVKEDQELFPWVYAVTVNVCRDLARKRNARKSVPLRDEHVEGLSDENALRRRLDAADEHRIVEQGLATLPEKERAAIVLRDIEGLTTKEVAAILGSSQTTVRSQISRARIKLKKYRDAALGENDEV